MLIASDTGNRNRAAEHIGLAINFAGGPDLRKDRAGYAKNFKEFLVPLAGPNIEKHGTRSIAGISDVLASAGEIPNEPGIDGAKGEFSAFGFGLGIGNVVENPLQLCSRKIGVNNEAGLATNRSRQASRSQLIARFRGAAILPDNRIADRFAGGAIPNNGCLALIGDSNGRDVAGGEVCFI